MRGADVMVGDGMQVQHLTPVTGADRPYASADTSGKRQRERGRERERNGYISQARFGENMPVLKWQASTPSDGTPADDAAHVVENGVT